MKLAKPMHSYYLLSVSRFLTVKALFFGASENVELYAQPGTVQEQSGQLLRLLLRWIKQIS